ncbi:chemotaxis protein CheY [Abditibacteriota bacterium]|nr:chemotaxis protein CheY [Abditibacteriota bacterium]
MHILFVDDISETRDLFRLCFTLQGHTAETAPNGMAALDIITHNADALDVVIMDYHMPEMTGLEVVERLRQRNDITQVPIILFTGDTMGEFESQAQKLGVARVVYKPILPAALIAAAQEVVTKSH